MPCMSPLTVIPKGRVQSVPVPCGRCPDCKKRRVDSWVFRLMEEDKVSVSGYFVTLTYSTEHVPMTNNGFMTLEKSALQKFFKRLRKEDGTEGIKYYAVGEYGTQNWRPHYHAIIFNVRDKESIFNAWKFGDVHVGNVSGDSIAYTLKYIDKPSRVPVHGRDDRLPEFSLMSKRLGASYCDNPNIQRHHRQDYTRICLTKQGGYKIALPRYYRQKLYTADEMEAQRWHIQSEMERRRNDGILKYGEEEYYRLQGEVKKQKYNKFYSSQKNRKDV